jgi:hypothetical protein
MISSRIVRNDPSFDRSIENLIRDDTCNLVLHI